jgi:hypothetical protein
MSDSPQGEGWWLASDGKWYPPQSAQTKSQGSARAWWKKKRFIIPLALVALVVVVSAVGGEDKQSTSTTGATPAKESSTTVKRDESTTTVEAQLFPGRPDAQKKDRERNIGQAAEFSGYAQQ